MALGVCLVAAAPGRGELEAGRARQSGEIRVEVNLVSVIASVLDENDRPAPNLSRDQFEIFDDGKPQQIAVFEPETHQPLDLALMMDTSLSEWSDLRFESEAAASFLARVVRPGDRAAVFEFSDTVTQLSGFTDNDRRLREALRRVAPGDGTSLYDAVYLGSAALARQASGRRKVLILITDAGETTSRVDFEAARRAALRAEALLYTIVIRPVQSENGRNTGGEHALETIADSTGGAMYYPDRITQLGAMFDQIDRELRTQYRLGYYPQPRPPQGVYRRIEVRVKGNYRVRYRKGYYTGPAD